jgi:hypothetical protein
MHATIRGRLFCPLRTTTIAIASMKALFRHLLGLRLRQGLSARRWASNPIATTAPVLVREWCCPLPKTIRYRKIEIELIRRGNGIPKGGLF